MKLNVLDTFEYPYIMGYLLTNSSSIMSVQFLSLSSSEYAITGVAAVVLTLTWFVRLASRHTCKYPCCSFCVAYCKLDASKNVVICDFLNSTGVKSILSLSGFRPYLIFTWRSLVSWVTRLAVTGL